MLTFWPIQQELDCVDDTGQVIGKIKFDGDKNMYAFVPTDKTVTLSDLQRSAITRKLVDLSSGKHTIPMQDDD